MMKKISALSALLLAAFSNLEAQQLPHYDLLLFSLNKGADSLWRPSAPRFLSGFNPRGYNSQPSFFSNNELYLTAQLPADTTQTDIYALDLLWQRCTRVTATRTAEYSPTLTPDGKRFSAIRVESDGAQRLWSFPVDRSDAGKPVFPNIKGVGYHCWLRDTLAALFIVGENGSPHSLHTVGLKGQKMQRIASNIGRCLQKMPDGRLAFVHKVTDQTWYVKAWDPRKQTAEILFKTLPGSEDFAIASDGAFLSGSGTKIYLCKPGRDADWRELADWSRYGVKNISRLALSKDNKLVAVVQ